MLKINKLWISREKLKFREKLVKSQNAKSEQTCDLTGKLKLRGKIRQNAENKHIVFSRLQKTHFCYLTETKFEPQCTGIRAVLQGRRPRA